MQANLYSVIAAAIPDPAADCFIERDRRTSYAQLLDLAGRIARLLRDKGVEPGDRIAVQAPKSVEMVALYLATLKLGAIFVPLNTAYTRSEIEFFLTDAEPRLFVDDARVLACEATGLEPLVQNAPCSADDLAAIVYTSGTTGRSKGAMLTHGNLAANARALCEAWAFTKDDVLLHALPIFHVHGLFVALHCALLTGSKMLWLERFDDAEVLRLLPQATVMMGVPTFYTRLLATEAFTKEVAAAVRVYISGSAPLLQQDFRAFEERTGKHILERYGMSEAVIITSNPLNGDRVAGSVGYPLPGLDLRVAGGEDIGLIEIRGPSVFKGYWRAPEKTAEEFTGDGYFITGDLGRKDPDGRVWITGRAKDLIISGGYNVYPKEVELVLDSLAGIEESAVIGVPHPDFGEAVVAVVVGAPDEAQVIATAREQLAGFKVPKRVIAVPELPRNALGKVQKNLLRDEHRGLFEGPKPTTAG